MNFKDKIKKIVLIFLDENYLEKSDENMYFRTIVSQLISKEENPTKKIKDLEVLVNRLSDKITILTDKIAGYEKKIDFFTTIQEELVNMFDQNPNDEESFEPDNLSDNNSDKKYGVN